MLQKNPRSKTHTNNIHQATTYNANIVQMILTHNNETKTSDKNVTNTAHATVTKQNK